MNTPKQNQTTTFFYIECSNPFEERKRKKNYKYIIFITYVRYVQMYDIVVWNTYISCAVVAIYQVCSTLAFLQPDKNSGISAIEQKASLKMHGRPFIIKCCTVSSTDFKPGFAKTYMSLGQQKYSQS